MLDDYIGRVAQLNEELMQLQAEGTPFAEQFFLMAQADLQKAQSNLELANMFSARETAGNF